MNNRPLIFFTLFILAFGAAIYLGPRGCNRTPEPTPSQPEQVLNRELLTDSIESAVEEKYRARETKVIQAYSDSLAQIKAKLPKSKDKATKSVIQYQNAPNLANCDTAIADLQNHVAQVESGLAFADSVMKRQSNVIGSQKGTILRKDSTIAAVSDVARGLVSENAGLQKQNAKKWAIGIQAGYGLAPTGHAPYIGIGVGYNLFRF